MNISINFLAIVMCIFTVRLTCRNVTIDKKKSMYFKWASILTIVMLILECITVICNEYQDVNYILLHNWSNALGFGLSPLIIIVVSFLHWDNMKRYKVILFIPWIIHMTLSIASIKTGWIFRILPDNSYMRGELFWEHLLCNGMYYAILVYCSFKELQIYDNNEKGYLSIIASLVVLGVIIQVKYSNFLLIWGMVSLSTLLYYVFLRELQFRFDPLTLTYNRTLFQEDMARLRQEKRVQIIVMDVNSLKQVNDHFGHVAGDTIIKTAAQLIREEMKELGNTYRIGGDEFCVLVEGHKEEEVRQALARFEYKVEEYNRNSKDEFSIEIAYGMSEYNSIDHTNLYDTFKMADDEMYQCKTCMKMRA